MGMGASTHTNVFVRVIEYHVEADALLAFSTPIFFFSNIAFVSAGLSANIVGCE